MKQCGFAPPMNMASPLGTCLCDSVCLRIPAELANLFKYSSEFQPTSFGGSGAKKLSHAPNMVSAAFRPNNTTLSLIPPQFLQPLLQSVLDTVGVSSKGFTSRTLETQRVSSR